MPDTSADQGRKTPARAFDRLPGPLRDLLRAGREQWRDAATLLGIAADRLRRRPTDADARTPHVLLVDDAVPDPLLGFGFPRTHALVRSLLRGGYRVSFYPMWADRPELARMEELFGGAARFHPGSGARGLRRLLWREGATVDLLFITREKPMAAFHRARWRPSGTAPGLVYDMEAVVTPREARRRSLYGPAWSGEEEARALRSELHLGRGADAVTVVTPADQALVDPILHLPTYVLSYPVAVRGPGAAFDSRKDFLFVGRLTGPADSYPNVDAVGWFIDEVMPELDARIGTDYKVHLIGMTDEGIRRRASDRVIVHGPVDDLAPFFERCRVFVAPTRFAAGLPIKVVETLGKGLPCVTTPLLAEQIGAAGHGFAPDPSAGTFADRCAVLYTDEAAWRAARDYGLEHARRFFSEEAFDAVVAQLIASAARRPGE